MNVQRARKLPVVNEVMQWNGDNIKELWEWAGADNIYGPTPEHPEEIRIITLEDQGTSETVAKHIAKLGDWVIRGVEGEFYFCKPEIFAKTYEIVE